jgi:sec-independent protein translocase protein TatA
MGFANPVHIVLLLILLLLVFGAKRLPEMGRSLGSGMRGFKESLGGESAQPELNAPQPEITTTPAGAPAAEPVVKPVVAPTEEPRGPLAA